MSTTKSTVTHTSGALVPYSRQYIKEEVGPVAHVLKEERNKGCVTVGIVEEQSLRKLQKVCQQRGVFGRAAPPMLFTTAELLQDTIDQIKLSDKHRTLKILASSRITAVSFHISSHFKELIVLRCCPSPPASTASSTHRRDASSRSGRLFIEGSSTYNGVRLDKWQAHRRKNHTLIIGHEGGVRIRVADVATLPHWGRARSSPFSEAEQRELRGHFKKLTGDTTDNRSGGGDDIGALLWDKLKGTVAAVMGMAVGTMKLNVDMNAAVGGLTVKYQFGVHAFELGVSGAKVNAVATAAGSAVTLGMAAAAAVYFIPWESLFEWLRLALHSVWDSVCAVWQRFKDMVVSLFVGWSEGKKSGKEHISSSGPLTLVAT